MTIASTKNGFTLSGFSINGGVTVYSNTGALTLNDLGVRNTTGDGIIVVDQAGATTVTNVESSENRGIGFVYSNTNLATAYPLTVTNSEFNNNGANNDMDEAGALIYNKGPVTVNGVSASGNKGDGMFIYTLGTVIVKNGIFSNNTERTGSYEMWGDGLLVYNQTNGSAVTLENVQVHGNADTGVWVAIRGPVTAKNITASRNRWQGMLVSNDYPNTGLYFPTTVSITDSEFNLNGWHGLEILATGTVTLSYINANNNDGGGVYIDNCLWKDTACRGTGLVTILNPYQTPATYSFNGYSSYGPFDGLNIISAGTVSITGISASWNAGNGVNIMNNIPGKIGGVTINALPATDTIHPQSGFYRNNGYGIAIYSNGAIAINGTPTYTMRVDRNGSGGIVIGESTAPAGRSVLIKGVDLYNNSGDAIFIINKGAITLDTVWVNNPWGLEMYTSGYGFNLNNAIGTGGVTITNSAANYVGEYGFYILSKGAVSLKNVSTFRTGKAGMHIDNIGASLAQPVTITDGKIEQAHGTGIEILSRGTVAINGTNLFNNSGSHLPQNSIDLNGYANDVTWFDFYGAAGDTVSITMNYNGYANIQLINVGNNGEVIWSDGSGYWSDTFASPMITLPQDGIYYVILDWDSDWHTDYNYLLNFRFNSTSPFSNSAEGYNGIYIDNSSGVGDVTIQGTTINPNPWVSNNSGNGIMVLSKGNIKLLKTNIQCNKEAGVILINSIASTPKSVTAGNLDIYDNGGNGLFINSIGAVSLSNIASRENYASGILVDNCIYDSGLKKCKGAGAIILNGTANDLSVNGNYGGYFYTVGSVTINNLDTGGNGTSGVYIGAPALADLAVKPATGGVTLTKSGNFFNTANDNGAYGWYVYTYGRVALQNLSVNNNLSTGIYIDNSNAAAAKPVSLTDVNVNTSGNIGIDIHALGTVTLKGTSASKSFTKNVSIMYGQTVEGLAAGDLEFSFDVGDGANIDIFFNAPGFEGNVTLLDPTDYPIASGFGDIIDFHFPSAVGGIYVLKIYQWNNTPFYYKVSINDSNPNTVENSYLTPIDGIRIDNSGGTGDVILGKSTTGQIVYATDNTGSGISIFTRGNVQLATAYVANNLGSGINLNVLPQAKTVAITDITVENNGGHGLSILSSGPVVWTTGNISSNGEYGVDINNSSASSAAPVTLSKVNILDSQGFGLNIWSNGTVTLTDLKVLENQGDGINVLTKGGIILTRVKSMMNVNNHTGYGAYLNNYGYVGLYPPAVTIIDSDFSYNKTGLDVHAIGAVSLQGVNVTGNYEHGYHLNLGDTVTSMLPGYYWEYIDNYDSISGGEEANWTFTVTEVNDDVAIYLNGDTEMSVLDSNGNYIPVDHWVDGNRHFILQPGEYTIRVYNYWSDGNLVYQLGIDANPINAPAFSGSGGAVIDAKGNVTIARSTTRGNSNFNRNSGNGLEISSNGSTTISDVNTHLNLGVGMNILNSTTGKPVSLTRVTSVDNRSQNVQINAYGPVTWNSGGSFGSQYGAILCNNNATTPGQPVTISNVDFNGATIGSGLIIKSAGIVTLTKVGASWNGADGVVILILMGQIPQ